MQLLTIFIRHKTTILDEVVLELFNCSLFGVFMWQKVSRKNITRKCATRSKIVSLCHPCLPYFGTCALQKPYKIVEQFHGFLDTLDSIPTSITLQSSICLQQQIIVMLRHKYYIMTHCVRRFNCFPSTNWDCWEISAIKIHEAKKFQLMQIKKEKSIHKLLQR